MNKKNFIVVFASVALLSGCNQLVIKDYGSKNSEVETEKATLIDFKEYNSKFGATSKTTPEKEIKKEETKEEPFFKDYSSKFGAGSSVSGFEFKDYDKKFGASSKKENDKKKVKKLNNKEKTTLINSKCYLSTEEKAPQWVCDNSFKGYTLTTVENFEKSDSKGKISQEEVVLEKAKTTLIVKFKNEIEKFVKEEVKGNKKADIDAIVKDVHKTVYEQIKDAVKVLNTWNSSENNLYSQFGIDPFTIKTIITNNIQESQKNSPKIWGK